MGPTGPAGNWNTEVNYSATTIIPGNALTPLTVPTCPAGSRLATFGGHVIALQNANADMVGTDISSDGTVGTVYFRNNQGTSVEVVTWSTCARN